MNSVNTTLDVMRTMQIAVVTSVFGLVLCALPTATAVADEGGVSFWLPGSFGSLAATPQAPGWTMAAVYYHTSVDAEGKVAAAREISTGSFTRTVDISTNLQLEADADLLMINPNYVFATPVLGGQLGLGITALVAHSEARLNGTLTLAGPYATVTREGRRDDSISDIGDLYPQASLRWNMGVNNYMVYLKGDIPVGAYDRTRLANVGIGHGAVDGGLGYTYFDPAKGYELSAVAGLTGNFENPDTDYTNGVNVHLDWGASKFLTPTLHAGLVGYYYDQLSGDSGGAPILGDFKSQVAAIGPQAGFMFTIGGLQCYANLKGYLEFEAENRPEGWNLWLTFAISPPAPQP
jgi:hypothetical protein